jgi:ComF family protein
MTYGLSLRPRMPGRSLLARVGRLALDVLLPPRCLMCEATVEAQNQLCGACWSRIRYVTEPMCACCGLPFSFDTGLEPGGPVLCGDCLREPPRFRKARAVMVYDDGSREAVLAFKHGDRTDAAPAYGMWLARAGAELLAEADCLVPVPLHPARLFHRRYNQSALLAHALGRVSGLLVVSDALRRTRNTPSQGTRSRVARLSNVRGAFAMRASRERHVRDKRVVLVDDVLTTGSTVEACAAILLRAGAVHVDVLTLARVVRDGAA